MKRILRSLLCLILVLSMSVPSYAAGANLGVFNPGSQSDGLASAGWTYNSHHILRFSLIKMEGGENILLNSKKDDLTDFTDIWENYVSDTTKNPKSLWFTSWYNGFFTKNKFTYMAKNKNNEWVEKTASISDFSKLYNKKIDTLFASSLFKDSYKKIGEKQEIDVDLFKKVFNSSNVLDEDYKKFHNALKIYLGQELGIDEFKDMKISKASVENNEAMLADYVIVVDVYAGFYHKSSSSTSDKSEVFSIAQYLLGNEDLVKNREWYSDIGDSRLTNVLNNTGGKVKWNLQGTRQTSLPYVGGTPKTDTSTEIKYSSKTNGKYKKLRNTFFYIGTSTGAEKSGAVTNLSMLYDGVVGTKIYDNFYSTVSSFKPESSSISSGEFKVFSLQKPLGSNKFIYRKQGSGATISSNETTLQFLSRLLRFQSASKLNSGETIEDETEDTITEDAEVADTEETITTGVDTEVADTDTATSDTGIAEADIVLSDMEEVEVVANTVSKASIAVDKTTRIGAMGAMTFYVKKGFFVTDMTKKISTSLMNAELLESVFPTSVKWVKNSAGVGYTYDFAAKGEIEKEDADGNDLSSKMVHTKTILNTVLANSDNLLEYFWDEADKGYSTKKTPVRTFSFSTKRLSYNEKSSPNAEGTFTSYGQSTGYENGKLKDNPITKYIEQDFTFMFDNVLNRTTDNLYISAVNCQVYTWKDDERVELTTSLGKKGYKMTDIYVDTTYDTEEQKDLPQKYTFTCEVFYRISTVSSNEHVIELSESVNGDGTTESIEIVNFPDSKTQISKYTTDTAQSTKPDAGTKAYIIVPNYLYGDKTLQEFKTTLEEVMNKEEEGGFTKENLKTAIVEAMNAKSASRHKVVFDGSYLVNEYGITLGKIAFGDDIAVGEAVKFGAITYNKAENVTYNVDENPTPASAAAGGVDDNVSGYTVIEFRVNTEVEEIKGEGILLPAYYLNRYYENVIARSSLASEGVVWSYIPQTNADYIETYDYKNAKKIIDEYPSFYKAGNDLSTSIGKNSKTVYKDTSYSGNETQYEKSTTTLSGLYFLQATNNVKGFKRGDSFNGITLETALGASGVFDYTFNLIRSQSGDVRTLSSLMYSSVKADAMVDTSESINTNLKLDKAKNLIFNATGVGDTNNVLKLDFGSTPKTVKTVSKTNNSDVIFAENDETIKVTAYNFSVGTTLRNESEYGEYVKKDCRCACYSLPYTFNGITSSISHCNVEHCAGNHRAERIATATEDLKAFVLTIDGKERYSTNVMEYSFTDTTYKYKAYSISVGRVSGITGTATMVATGLTKNLSNGTEQMKNKNGTGTDAAQYLSSTAEGYVKSADAYRNVAVNETGVVINFYPEVRMLANALQKTSNGSNSWTSQLHSYNVLFTMGEVKRTVNQSSMYIVSLDTSTTKNPVSGTVYSDSMQGSTSVSSTKYPIIPAGSDVNITVNAENITVDLYGYALDVINKDIDSTMDYKDGTAKYSDIIKSNEDLDTAWSNSDTYKKAQTSFVEWARGVLKKENFGADLLLSVDAQKKAFTNFGATIGKIVDNNSSTDALDSSFADGVFPIAVKNGKILKDNAEYKALIKQIAKDYYNDETKTTEAEKVFEQSGVYTALLNAIESSTSSKNKSGKADAGVSSLHGGTDITSTFFDDNNNWYDEVVRTFVIRRYKYEGAKFKDIIATDKVDYGTGVNSNSSNSQNASKNNQNVAKWYLTLYFNEKACKNGVVGKTLLGDTASYYNPSKSSSLGNALSTNTVLLSNNYIDGADFVLPASTTSDFNR